MCLSTALKMRFLRLVGLLSRMRCFVTDEVSAEVHLAALTRANSWPRVKFVGQCQC